MLARHASRTDCAAQTEVVPVEDVWAATSERKRETGRSDSCMLNVCI